MAGVGALDGDDERHDGGDGGSGVVVRVEVRQLAAVDVVAVAAVA